MLRLEVQKVLEVITMVGLLLGRGPRSPLLATEEFGKLLVASRWGK